MSKIIVRRHGSGWQYRFETAPVGGKRKEKSKSGFRTKAEAQQAGAKAYAEYSECGMAFTPSEMSVADYLNFWYEAHCTTNLRVNTCIAYRHCLDNHIIPALGYYKLKALRPDAIQKFVDGLKLKGLSRNWVKNIKSTLSGALDYAVYPCEYIKENPCRYVRMPKFDKKQADRTVVTEENWKKIVERFKGTRFYVPLMIGYYTGARISEVLALTWDDVDLERRIIRIDKQLLHEGSYFKLAPPKTDNSVRSVVFGSTLADILTEHKNRSVGKIQGVRYYLDDGSIMFAPASVPVNLQEVHFVCTADDGELTTQNSFKYASKIIHYELGIKDFCFHSLRHTHATILMNHQANPKEVQCRLGHSSIRTTLGTYTNSTTEGALATAEIFEENAASTRPKAKNRH